MAQTEVYLPDARVLPLQERLYIEFPILVEYNTDLVTVRHEGPYSGTLPDGSTGTTPHSVVQFVVVSDYPRTRNIQRKYGVRHGTVAIAFEQAWEEAEREFRNGHYVNAGSVDPLERIFRALLAKHLTEMDSLASIMN